MSSKILFNVTYLCQIPCHECKKATRCKNSNPNSKREGEEIDKLVDGLKKARLFRRTGRYYVYILECSDGTYYTGYTPDIERRLKLHNAGKGARYTRDRRPVGLVWRKEYRYFKPAFLTEKRIKNLTRQQKEALVNGKRLHKVFMDAGK